MLRIYYYSIIFYFILPLCGTYACNGGRLSPRRQPRAATNNAASKAVTNTPQDTIIADNADVFMQVWPSVAGI